MNSIRHGGCEALQTVHQPEIVPRAGKRSIIEQKAIVKFRIENTIVLVENKVKVVGNAVPIVGRVLQCLFYQRDCCGEWGSPRVILPATVNRFIQAAKVRRCEMQKTPMTAVHILCLSFLCIGPQGPLRWDEAQCERDLGQIQRIY